MREMPGANRNNQEQRFYVVVYYSHNYSIVGKRVFEGKCPLYLDSVSLCRVIATAANIKTRSTFLSRLASDCAINCTSTARFQQQAGINLWIMLSKVSTKGWHIVLSLVESISVLLLQCFPFSPCVHRAGDRCGFGLIMMAVRVITPA